MMKRRLLPLLLGLALFGAACTSEGTADDSTRDDSGSIVEGGDVGVLALEIGDCFDVPSSAISEEPVEVASVGAIPCTDAHDNQVAAKFNLTGSDWPGVETVQMDSALGCVDRFEGITGEAYETSALDIFPIYPTEQSWEAGDREVICSLYNFDGSKLSVDLLA
jgi:hypothetical protein